jgi:DNA-binding response OmpR family regulator
VYSVPAISLEGVFVPKRIMVINDTQEILELFQLILGDEGYEVVIASFTTHEIPEIRRVKPDLLILDYAVGKEGQGWQLLQKLKMVKDTAHIPVIVCTTAMRLAKDIEGYLTSKGVLIVPKPFDVEQLLDAVNKSLSGEPPTPDYPAPNAEASA